jgi:16S rRNA processing protein RimM
MTARTDGSAAPDDEPGAASNPGAPPTDLVRVGYIFRPHGVKGELKVKPETDDPAQFESFETVFVGPDAVAVAELGVESVRYQESKRGLTVILRLDEIDTRETAQSIVKQWVFVPEDDLDLTDAEVFIHDLIGLDVVDEEGEPVGMVSNLMELPGHDVLVLRRTDGREALVPLVEDFVIEIDLDAERIVVRLIEGMIDE